MKPPLWIVRSPWLLILSACCVLTLGWVGMARCEELYPSNVHYLGQQVVWSALAGLMALAATIPNYRVLARWSYMALLFSLALLVAVYLFPPVNGARRWIRFGPVGFQPSELAKVAFILGLAHYLTSAENWRRLSSLLLPLGLTLLPVLLILHEPDLGTALIFLPVLFAMLWAAGARRADLAILALAGLLALPLLWTQMSREQRSRVTALFEQIGPGQPATADTYQLRQAKQVLLLGGLWGSLLAGQTVDDPGAYHLPEARSDFIFAVIGERLGLAGIGAMLCLYAVMVWQGTAIALRTREPFGRLVAVGLTSLVGFQTLINTGMTVGLLPVTGLSLPLASYGGSGLVTYGLVIGLLWNIGIRPGYEVTKEPFRYVLERGTS